MKITETIHALKHTFFIPVRPDLKIERFVYSYVIFGKENIYLIDSGVTDSAKPIFDSIIRNGRTVDETQSLIFTHSHPDHIGAAKRIKEKTACKIIMHPNEKEWVEDIEKQFANRPVPGFNSLVGGPVQIDRLVDDGDMIHLEENISIKVIHTPGHSNGSISLFLDKEGILFSGDSVLLPGHLPIYDDAMEAVASVRKLQQLPSLNILLSSWDDPCSGDQVREKMDQSILYFERIHKIIKEIENVTALEPTELCKQVIDILELPTGAVNPLTVRSFLSNVKALGDDIIRPDTT